MALDTIQWALVAEGKLSLVDTKIVVVFVGGPFPYHVHRLDACLGAAQRLTHAKEICAMVVADLIQMGLEP